MQLSDVLMTLPQTKAEMAKVPPELLVATGHEDLVMIFLLRIGDSHETAKCLGELITLAEIESVMDNLRRTRGLIKKWIDIDTAQQLKKRLSDASTEIEFVLPIDDENGTLQSVDLLDDGNKKEAWANQNLNLGNEPREKTLALARG